MLSRIFFILAMTTFLIWTPLAFAIPCDPGDPGVCVPVPPGGGNNIEPVLPDSPTGSNFTSGATLIGDFVTKVLPIAIGLGGFLTVIFIIVSGIQFITSSGNPEAANAARNRLTFAIVGFVILALSFLIVQFINNTFLGSTDFQ